MRHKKTNQRVRTLVLEPRAMCNFVDSRQNLRTFKLATTWMYNPNSTDIYRQNLIFTFPYIAYLLSYYCSYYNIFIPTLHLV